MLMTSSILRRGHRGLRGGMYRPQHLADGHAVQFSVLLHLIWQVVGASTSCAFGIFQAASGASTFGAAVASIVVTIAGVDAIDPISTAAGGHHGVIRLILILNRGFASVFAIRCEFGA